MDIDADIDEMQRIIEDRCPSCRRPWGNYADHLRQDRSLVDQMASRTTDPISCIRTMNNLAPFNLNWEYEFDARNKIITFSKPSDPNQRPWSKVCCEEDYEYLMIRIEVLRKVLDSASHEHAQRKGIGLKWNNNVRHRD